MSGAGLGIQQALWAVPGTSRTLLDAAVPYDQGAFDELVGRRWADVGSYCSELASIGLAQYAYFRAQELAHRSATPSTRVAGLGLTAAVSTDRVRRGANRVHATVRTGEGIWSVELVMDAGGGRSADGAIADLVGLNLLLHAAGLEQVPFGPGCAIESPQLTETKNGRILVPIAPEATDVDKLGTALIDVAGKTLPVELDPARHIVLAGSFNPMQYGHDRIARTVAAVTGLEPVLEITGHNIEKTAQSMEALAKRSAQMRGRWPVIVTLGNTRFIDKARAYGRCSFAVGYDTAVRIVNPAYYDDGRGMIEAFETFARMGVRFHVIGRVDATGIHRTLADVQLPQGFESLFVGLPGRFDISSTEIRAAAS